MRRSRQRAPLTLFQNRINMEPLESAWTLQAHAAYLRDQRWYAKKRRPELAAVTRNLQRYMNLLAATTHPRTLQAGFLHPEPHGMVAIDQRGASGDLQPTRLYCFADGATRTVHLLGIGSKADQAADLARLVPLAQTLNR